MWWLPAVVSGAAFCAGGPMALPRGVNDLGLSPLSASTALPLPAPLSLPALQETAAALKGAALSWYLTTSLPMGLPADDVMLGLVSPEAFWLLREWRKQAYGAQDSMRQVLESARQQILALGQTVPALRGATVHVRSKGLWSTFHKATVRQKQVHDVQAVRVVVRGNDENAVYDALDAIRAVYPRVGGRFKDYVRFPKANGYQGLHDTLRLPSGQPFEVQVRTEGMHTQAEIGTAAHRRYKQGPSLLSQRMLSGMVAAVPSSRGSVVAPMRWPLHPQTALSLATRLAAGAH